MWEAFNKGRGCEKPHSSASKQTPRELSGEWEKAPVHWTVAVETAVSSKPAALPAHKGLGGVKRRTGHFENVPLTLRKKEDLTTQNDSNYKNLNSNKKTHELLKSTTKIAKQHEPARTSQPSPPCLTPRPGSPQDSHLQAHDQGLHGAGIHHRLDIRRTRIDGQS